MSVSSFDSEGFAEARTHRQLLLSEPSASKPTARRFCVGALYPTTYGWQRAADPCYKTGNDRVWWAKLLPPDVLLQIFFLIGEGNLR